MAFQACKVIRTAPLALPASTLIDLTFPTGSATEVYKSSAAMHSLTTQSERIYNVLPGWHEIKFHILIPASFAAGGIVQMVSTHNMPGLAGPSWSANGTGLPLLMHGQFRSLITTTGCYIYVGVYANPSTTVTGALSIRGPSG